MQCSNKVTGIFIGARKCKRMHLSGRYKRSNCSNKDNNIWTCTSPYEHRAAPIWSKVAPRKNIQKYLTENVAKNHQDRDNVKK